MPGALALFRWGVLWFLFVGFLTFFFFSPRLGGEERVPSPTSPTHAAGISLAAPGSGGVPAPLRGGGASSAPLSFQPGGAPAALPPRGRPRPSASFSAGPGAASSGRACPRPVAEEERRLVTCCGAKCTACHVLGRSASVRHTPGSVPFFCFKGQYKADCVPCLLTCAGEDRCEVAVPPGSTYNARPTLSGLYFSVGFAMRRL